MASRTAFTLAASSRILRAPTFILTPETPVPYNPPSLSGDPLFLSRFIISAGNINRHAPSVFPKSRYSGSPRDLALISQRAMSIPLIVLVLIPFAPC